MKFEIQEEGIHLKVSYDIGHVIVKRMNLFKKLNGPHAPTYSFHHCTCCWTISHGILAIRLKDGVEFVAMRNGESVSLPYRLSGEDVDYIFNTEALYYESRN